MTIARPLPTLIGPTENTLRALLTKTLSTTRIKTYPAWVVLNALANAAGSGSTATHRAAAADALKVETDDVEAIVVGLRAVGLVDADDSPTAFGAAELAAARSAVSATTARLVDGIGDEEQATVRLVLEHIRARAEALLRA